MWAHILQIAYTGEEDPIQLASYESLEERGGVGDGAGGVGVAGLVDGWWSVLGEVMAGGSTGTYTL